MNLNAFLINSIFHEQTKNKLKFEWPSFFLMFLNFHVFLLVFIPQLLVLWIKYKLQPQKNLPKIVKSSILSTLISLFLIFSFKVENYHESVSKEKYFIQTYITTIPRSILLAFVSLLFNFSQNFSLLDRFKSSKISYFIISFLIIGFGYALLQMSHTSYDYMGRMELDQIVYNLLYQMPGLETKYYFQAYALNYFLPKFYQPLLIFMFLVLIFPCQVSFDDTLFCFNGMKNLEFELNLIEASIVVFIGYIINAVANMDVINLSNFESTDIYKKYYINPTNVIIDYPEKPQNLILIQMESMETTFGSIENGGSYNVSYIPEMEKLAMDPENTHFSDIDKLGGVGKLLLSDWTNGALVGYNAGIPLKLGKLPGKKFLTNVVTLTDILDNAGYKIYNTFPFEENVYGNTYIYQSHGNATIYDVNYILKHCDIPKEWRVGEDVYDVAAYKFTKETLPKIAALGKPFAYVHETLDTHMPVGRLCPLCRNDPPTAHASGRIWHCASRQIYDFVEWFKQQPFYHNTTLFITGDHLFICAKGIYIESKRRRIFNTFVNPVLNCSMELRKNRKIATYDWFPTILASLGFKISGERLALGTNLFSGVKTLLEEGVDFNSQVVKYSKYYYDRMLSGDNAPGVRVLGKWY